MKKQYEELQEKYTLPQYDELNRDFDIYNISKEDDLIKEILKKIDSTIEEYISLLEDIIQPDSSYYALKEVNEIDTETRKKVNKTYSKLMHLNRQIIEIKLDYSEQTATQFIKKTYDEWQNIKQELLPIIKILKDTWVNNKETKNEGGYFG